MTKINAAAMDSETMQMLSMINEEKDCNIVINAEGIIQFANKGLTYVSLLTVVTCSGCLPVQCGISCLCVCLLPFICIICRSMPVFLCTQELHGCQLPSSAINA